MKRLAVGLLVLAACRPSHAFLNPATLRFDEGAAETWDALALAGPHVHPAPAADCAELRRLLLEGGRVAGAGEAAGRMAEAVEAMIVQMHGPAYGGPGKLLLALGRYPEGRQEPDRFLFLVVPEPRAEEVERVYRAPELQGVLHENRPEPSASLTSGTLALRRLPSGRLRFSLDLALGGRGLKAEVEAPLRR